MQRQGTLRVKIKEEKGKKLNNKRQKMSDNIEIYSGFFFIAITLISLLKNKS